MNIIFDPNDQRHQQIELNSHDSSQSTHLITHHQVEIQLTHRKVLRNETKSIDDFNQIFSQPIIDHKWESRYYSGHLIATCGHFVAYALKTQSGDDIVCVFYKQVDFRSVINPPFSGDIVDLAFSFSDDLLLACVDQASHLRIYRIEKLDEPNELEHTLILFVDLQYSNRQCPSTVTWCCFIPDNTDDEDENDAYTMMSITRGSQVEVLNVAIASQSFISENILTLNQIENGRLSYKDHNGNVTCVCFSPDGTALGTATDQGEIKFFSINFEQPMTCRCLHLWIPHEGRPISSLFFLDDHQNLTQDTQLWRYAVSGCDQNRELKVWSCTNWSCLQVIRFQYVSMDSAFHPPSTHPTLQASIDLTSRFLILSDIHRNCLYVLTIYQHSEENRAYFSSINAFPTIDSPSLSFAITTADQYHSDRSSNEQTDLVKYAVKMYSIHTKCFQEILLMFKTAPFMNSTMAEDQNNFDLTSYMRSLHTTDVPASSTSARPIDYQLTTASTCSIHDLLTSTNLSNGETAQKTSLPTLDPLHGLLLGSTTAFDTIPTPQQIERVNQICPGTTGLTQIVFEPVSTDDVDTVFLPIKAQAEDEPELNGNHDPLLPPSSRRTNVSDGRELENYSDPTETSDKDDDSTADEEDLIHSRPKRRTGRSPSSSQISSNIDTLNEIRQLTKILNEMRHQSDSRVPVRTQSDYDDKLEQCCQRLDYLTSKVDRLISFEQSGVVSRPSRPSPHSAPVEILLSNEPTTTLSDVNYDRLETILIEKIQSYLQTAINAAFEPYHDLKDNLHKDLAAKLLATDSVLKQTISQIFRSKSMIDSLSHALTKTIENNMVTTYRDTFNQLVIPSFEKAAANMFQQTNDVFKRGTKEYLQEMIDYGRQQQRSLIQQREQMMNDIRKESAQLQKELEKKSQDLNYALRNEFTLYFTAQLTEQIQEKTHVIVREETTDIFRELFNSQKNEIQTMLRTTELPTESSSSINQMTTTADVKYQHVIRFLRQGQYNQAFEHALSASDLNLVLFVCESVRPNELFATQPCPLQTPVLLSLIQQLSADLTSHQELKYSYLAEALISLDLSNLTVREYSQRVLMDLSKNLMIYVQTNPSSSMSKRFQILWMTSQGLLQRIIQQRATPITLK